MSNKTVILPLREEIFTLLGEEAARRGVSIQEFLGAVIVPGWFRARGFNVENTTLGDRGESGSIGKLEKIIQELEVNPQSGILTIRGNRILLMPAWVLHSIDEWVVKTFGPTAAPSLLYEMGREAGRESMKLMENAGVQIRDSRELDKVREEFAFLWGWASLNTLEFDSGKRIVRSRATGSIFVGEKKGRTPVCHFGRGLDAGALGVMFGRPCESIEVACEGKRDDYCELVTGASAQIAGLAEQL